jgi:DNA-binding MarR family transcriptional regulator
MVQSRHRRETLGVLERELMLLSRHSLGGRATGMERRLERSAYHLLSRMQVQGPMSIGELAEAFGLDTSTVNRQTSAMLQAGLVERIADPDGGIARKLRVTEEGAAQLAADRATTLDGIGDLLTDWTPEQVAGLCDSLIHFNTSIERFEGRSWPRAEP